MWVFLEPRGGQVGSRPRGRAHTAGTGRRCGTGVAWARPWVWTWEVTPSSLKYAREVGGPSSPATPEGQHVGPPVGRAGRRLPGLAGAQGWGLGVEGSKGCVPGCPESLWGPVQGVLGQGLL